MQFLVEPHSQILSADKRTVATLLWGAVATVAVVFLLRGVQGAFQRELPTSAALIAVTFAGLINGVALRLFQTSAKPFPQPRGFWWATACTILPVVLLGLILIPASSVLGFGWLTVLAVGLMAETHRVTSEVPSEILLDQPATEDSSALEFNSNEFSHWMRRRLVSEADSTWDCMEGQISAEFAIGEKTVALHLPICPAMDVAPEVECETPGDVDCEWTITASHPYGLRLELRRRAQFGEPLTVPLQYSLAAPVQSSQSRAA